MTDASTNSNEQPSKTIKKRSTRSGKTNEYGTYIYRLFKQQHQNHSMAAPAMTVVNAVVSDIIDRYIDQSFKMCKLEGKSTLQDKHAHAAVYQILSGGLAKEAAQEGHKAVSAYVEFKGKELVEKEQQKGAETAVA